VTRAFALLGAGEFEPWSIVVDAWVGERARQGRILVLPTASAPEGDDVFQMWAAKGVAHYERAGVSVDVLSVKTRDDALDPATAEAVRDARAVFFSGGNPAYLATTLRDTALWRVIVEELDRGLAYMGCSAGVACLTERTFDTDEEDLGRMMAPAGLGFVSGVLFAPHWDTVDGFIPGATDFIAASVRERERLVGLDEQTALLGDGTEWLVRGTSGVHILDASTWAHHGDGDRFTLPIVT
jgi:cyanophycinase